LWSHVDLSQLEEPWVFLKRACGVLIHVTLGTELDETVLGLLRDKVAQIVSTKCTMYALEPGWATYPMPFLR
jgi:hypothetical protein